MISAKRLMVLGLILAALALPLSGCHKKTCRKSDRQYSKVEKSKKHRKRNKRGSKKSKKSRSKKEEKSRKGFFSK